MQPLRRNRRFIRLPADPKGHVPKGEIVFEDSEGEVNEIPEEDLPYDLGADVVSISPEAYGIWYLDCMERRDRYEGKTVEFTAMVLKTPDFPKNYFVPGRMAMTCCEDDMTFLGFVTKQGKPESWKQNNGSVSRQRLHMSSGEIMKEKAPCCMRSLWFRLSRLRDLCSFRKNRREYRRLFQII